VKRKRLPSPIEPSAKGNPGTALKYYEAALAIHRRIGHKQGVASALGNIGSTSSARGKPDKALKYYEAALAIARGIGHQPGTASGLANIGRVLISMGKYEQAVPKFGEALAVIRASGLADGPGQVLRGLVTCEDKLGRQRVEGLFKEAGLGVDTIANQLKPIDQMRQEMGRAGK